MASNDAVIFSNPESVAPPIGAYSHAAVVPADHRLVLISGQVGNDADGGLPQSVEAQYANALRNVVAIAESQGARVDQIVKLNTFAVKPMALDDVRRIRSEILGSHAPAATFIYVPRLAAEEFLIEVDAIAAITD